MSSPASWPAAPAGTAHASTGAIRAAAAAAAEAHLPGSAAGAAGCGAPGRVSGRRRRVPGGGPLPPGQQPGALPGAFPGVAPARPGVGVVQPGVGVGAPGVGAPGVGAPGVGAGRRRAGCRRAGCRRAGRRRRSGAADAARLVLEHPDVRLVPPVRGPRDVRVLLRRRVRRLEPRDAAGASRGVLGVLRGLRAGVREAGRAVITRSLSAVRGTFRRFQRVT